MISYNAVINVAAAWGRWRVALLCTRQLAEVGFRVWGEGFRAERLESGLWAVVIFGTVS